MRLGFPVVSDLFYHEDAEACKRGHFWPVSSGEEQREGEHNKHAGVRIHAARRCTDAPSAAAPPTFAPNPAPRPISNRSWDAMELTWWRLQAAVFLPLPLMLVAVLSTPAPRQARQRVLWFTEQVREGNRGCSRGAGRVARERPTPAVVGTPVGLPLG